MGLEGVQGLGNSLVVDGMARSCAMAAEGRSGAGGIGGW